MILLISTLCPQKPFVIKFADACFGDVLKELFPLSKTLISYYLAPESDLQV